MKNKEIIKIKFFGDLLQDKGRGKLVSFCEVFDTPFTHNFENLDPEDHDSDNEVNIYNVDVSNLSKSLRKELLKLFGHAIVPTKTK